MNKAVFLDKDGTLIPDIPYNVDPDLIMLSVNSIAGLQLLQRKGYLLLIVSNQSGVARGYFTEDKLQPVKEKIEKLFEQDQLRLSGFYYCPHYPEGSVNAYAINCNCRKPESGMLFKAANDLDIDLENSWMIGDILNDVEAGNRAGCRSVLIDNGNETEWIEGLFRTPLFKCSSINEAATHILSEQAHELAAL